MLYVTIANDMKEAMKNHDKDSLSTLRLLKSDIDLYLINNKMERNEAGDDIVIDVVSKQVKKHRESIEEFKKGNREDLIASYQKEIDILKSYMPEMLSDEEITSIINDAIAKIGATSVKEMGLVMKEITPLIKNRCDMKEVSSKIRDLLS